MKNLLRALLFLSVACGLRAQSTNVTNQSMFGTSNHLTAAAKLIYDPTSIVQFQIGTPAANKLVSITDSSGTEALIGLGAGLSISGGNLIAASSTSANPTATIGLAAVNGSAGSFMTSDSAPALSQAIIPTWTGLHTFSVTAIKTSGTDYGMDLEPTLNQRNATNFSMIHGNETITQAGSGNQFLEELAVATVDKWVVDSTGTVKTGVWGGSIIGTAFGGAGTINGALSANGSGTVAALVAGAGISITTGPATIQLVNIGAADLLANTTGGSAAPVDTTLTALIDAALGSTQGDVLYRSATAWSVLAPGTSGQFLKTGGAAANPAWGNAGGPVSTIQHDVATYSNTTGSFEDNQMANFTTTEASFTGANGTGLMEVFDTTAGTPLPIAQFWGQNVTAGNEAGITFGVANSTKNFGTLYFKNVSPSSNSNLVSIGFLGVVDAWTVNPVGAVATTSETLSGTIASSSTATGTLILSGTGGGLGVNGNGNFGGSITGASVQASSFQAGNGGNGGNYAINAVGAQTSANKLLRAITLIADNTATAVLTITVPNAAHSGVVKVTLTGSLGAGGAIGANEASGTASYNVVLTRTTGVNLVASIAAVSGLATANVLGGSIITVTGSLGSVTGAVGATNTVTVNVTIAHTTGSSTAHTCLVEAEIVNANISGITIS